VALCNGEATITTTIIIKEVAACSQPPLLEFFRTPELRLTIIRKRWSSITSNI
jgi:hypothetical protein